MKQAIGIVTDHGGRTCHAAIISRELGIPAVGKSIYCFVFITKLQTLSDPFLVYFNSLLSWYWGFNG
jgi:hypothetical protein